MPLACRAAYNRPAARSNRCDTSRRATRIAARRPSAGRTCRHTMTASHPARHHRPARASGRTRRTSRCFRGLNGACRLSRSKIPSRRRGVSSRSSGRARKARAAGSLLIALTSAALAAYEAALFAMMGRVVDWLASSTPADFGGRHFGTLAGFAAILAGSALLIALHTMVKHRRSRSTSRCGCAGCFTG